LDDQLRKLESEKGQLAVRAGDTQEQAEARAKGLRVGDVLQLLVPCAR